jgi:hypothetical protein
VKFFVEGENLLKKRTKIILTVIAILLLISAALAYYLFYSPNASLERLLREQFGDAFFDDFNDLPEIEDNNAQLEDVIAKYEPLFENLENRALERLEDLFQAALAEYNEKRKSGTINRFQFTNKYIQAGQMLEERVDASFYNLLGRMENELNRNNLPTEILQEIEQTYTTAKQQKKEELFSLLREKLGL